MDNKKIGIIVGVIIVAVVVVGLLWKRPVSAPVQPQPTPPPPPTSNLKTFSNSDLEFQYSPDYGFSSDKNSGQNYFAEVGSSVATVVIPREIFPKTNFGESTVTVAKSGKITNAADCRKYTTGGMEKAVTNETETINNITYDKAEFTDAGAGNLYDTRLYRFFYKGSCYEINVTLHTTQIANYPPGTVTEVNKDQAWGKLMEILNTLKFRA